MRKHFVKTLVLGVAISLLSVSLAFADTPLTETESETSYETTEMQEETTASVEASTVTDVVVGGLKDDSMDDLAAILGGIGKTPESEAELSDDTEEFNGTVETEPETEPSMPETEPVKPTEPETEPETSVPETEPETTAPETEPETTVPETQPETTAPETEPETTVPETQTETTVPETEPETSREYHDHDNDDTVEETPERVEILMIVDGNIESVEIPVSEVVKEEIPDTLPKAGDFGGVTATVGMLFTVLAVVSGLLVLVRRRYF